MAPTLTASLRRADIEAALTAVRDPELDEPITDLGFVRDLLVERGVVVAHLRLPTSFCSPSFAYLMASDALDVIRAVPGVTRAEVILDDHSDSPRINAGVAAGLGFTGAFPEETERELDELRRVFQVKAHMASIERVCAALARDGGFTLEQLPSLRISDLPSGTATDALLARRRNLGLSTDAADLVLVDDQGTSWSSLSLEMQLRFARTTRVSMAGNSHFCRGLLRTRYPDSEADQSDRAQETYAVYTRGKQS